MSNTKLFAVLCLLRCAAGQNDIKPVYKYRYETEDLMKTAASSIPLHGYHVVEGGYYPERRYTDIGSFGGGVGGGGMNGGFSGIRGGGGPGIINGGYSGGFSGGSRFGGGSLGGSVGGYGGGSAGGYGGGSISGNEAGSIGAYGGLNRGLGYTKLFTPAIGGFSSYPHHGHGGEYIDKSIYGGDKKLLNNENFERASENKHEEGKEGKEGYAQGKVILRNDKGEAGSYNGEEGGKKIVEDGKSYNGGQQFNQQGQNSDEQQQKKGHKKGRVVKGFKTSHHKDETGRTEEYYDEENDEAGNKFFNGKAGSFGENEQASFKGGHENEQFNAAGSKQQGHHDNQHSVDNSNADKGEYGQNKYYGNGRAYGTNNGIDQQSLLGHQENSRFYKHHPYHVPFYSD